jgi:hypothetical protein
MTRIRLDILGVHLRTPQVIIYVPSRVQYGRVFSFLLESESRLPLCEIDLYVGDKLLVLVSRVKIVKNCSYYGPYLGRSGQCPREVGALTNLRRFLERIAARAGL